MTKKVREAVYAAVKSLRLRGTEHVYCSYITKDEIKVILDGDELGVWYAKAQVFVKAR